MNKQRREQFEEAIGKLREIQSELVDLCNEESEAYLDMPESLRECFDKSEDIDYELGNLSSFIEDLESVIDE